MATATRARVTAEEFLKMDLGEGSFELVRGEIIPLQPHGPLHGLICVNLGTLVLNFGRRTGHGHAASGIALGISAETVRILDICFYREARWSRAEIGPGLPPIPPDLAAEVLEPSDRPGAIQARVADYLEAGVLMVRVVDPDRRKLTIYRQDDPNPRTLIETDFIDNLPKLPGFRCQVAEFFA